MSVFFYNIFLLLFKAAMQVASLFHGKAKKWVRGRKNVLAILEKTIPAGQPIIWVHCASLGEFEQGRPVMEAIREEYPRYRILLTFFSPSGYDAQKNYKGADWVFYLPMDGPRNARRFLEIVQPALVIFVKYEFWYYYLKKIRYRQIPLLLVSALFRKDMSFFKWYGSLQRKMLSRFEQIFVQNKLSKKLVDRIGLAAITTVSGDTRFDRVVSIAGKSEPVPEVARFIGTHKAIIAGSTWPEDETVLQKMLAQITIEPLKLVIAPHEISAKHLAELEKQFPGAARFSELGTNSDEYTKNVLIIDNIGLLSRIYRYGFVTYVGGGLRTMGVHNVLEAAVYGRIVLFGPYYRKYSEAIGLVQSGGGLSFYDPKKDGSMPAQLLEALLQDKDEYAFRCQAAAEYVRSNTGATRKIIHYIQEKRLLTN